MLFLGLIIIPNTLLGAVITFSGSLLYEAYAEVEQPFNLSLMTDQQLGGLLLWVLGDMMSIIAAGILMVMWYQHEEAKDQLDVASGKVESLEPDGEHICQYYLTEGAAPHLIRPQRHKPH
ncbi:MAG TPA: cytochrome c oxidase assembly protein [Dehalococcoidia bacterium]|nr:cytochrome c oxidase assembly protein [Dehalococcoidia bacterium]